MKFLTFVRNGAMKLGIKTEFGVVDVEAALSRVPPIGGNRVPETVQDLLEGGEAALAAIKDYVDLILSKGKGQPFFIEEQSLTWGPCVPQPSKIICVGMNYRKHAEETNAEIPKFPILFNKFNNTLTGHRCQVAVPDVTQQLDYEAELVIVMGREAKSVSKEEALDYVFGYCAVNDLSARDLQMRTSQWLLGKSCDGFSPLGPYLVSADEVGNPNLLNIRTTVNGEVRQSSNTSDMIFHCDEIISYISKHMTLLPGDIILTGTPEGVVLGYPKDRQVYLKPGDEVTIEIEKLGALTNKFVGE